MKIFYRRGYRYVDLSFRDNRAQLQRFLNSVEEALENDRVEKLVIRSYASPDGSEEANAQLAEGRAEELKNYLVNEGNIPASLIEHHAEGIAWDMLRQQVAASEMEGRDEVLSILDHTPVWVFDDQGRVVGSRKKELMDLQGGRPYRYMLEHFFPDLRNSSNTVLYLRIIEKADESNEASSVTSAAQSADAVQPVTTAPSVQAEPVTPVEETVPETPTVTAESSATAASDGTREPSAALSGDRYPRHIFGLHAGYCSSWITSYGMKSSIQSGYEVGFTYRLGLSRQYPVYFRTGLNFISKGYEVNGFDDTRTVINYLQLPVGIDYTIALGKHLALIPSAGLYYAFGVWGKRQVGDEKVCLFGSDGGFSRHDMGFQCGLDVAFYRFFVGAEYQHGLIDIDKNDTMYGDNSQMIGYKHVQNRCWVVKAGIYF
ncbi:OmpA family protein [Barnesiella viscericola]|uniref:OmpA family protein n=1 Tax=Barnesiella viscericola TaxID=397865 RepID=UPI003208C7D6